MKEILPRPMLQLVFFFPNLLFHRQLAKLFEHQIAISHAACSAECEGQRYAAGQGVLHKNTPHSGMSRYKLCLPAAAVNYHLTECLATKIVQTSQCLQFNSFNFPLFSQYFPLLLSRIALSLHLFQAPTPKTI